ncbi:hypothetical protein [Oscillibacter sp.]|nr:hypothetical protein [Oscillibacter sp.]
MKGLLAVLNEGQENAAEEISWSFLIACSHEVLVRESKDSFQNWMGEGT